MEGSNVGRLLCTTYPVTTADTAGVTESDMARSDSREGVSAGVCAYQSYPHRHAKHFMQFTNKIAFLRCDGWLRSVESLIRT